MVCVLTPAIASVVIVFLAIVSLCDSSHNAYTGPEAQNFSSIFYGTPWIQTTEVPPTNGTTAIPVDHLDEKQSTYQCFYHENFSVYCQEIQECPGSGKLYRKQLQLGLNRSFDGYECNASFSHKNYFIKSGIASPGLAHLLQSSKNSSDLLFVCHFFAHQVPSEQSFTCSSPVDCRHRGAISSCSGGTPWFGLWTGDLELGLWGVVTNEAMESAHGPK